MASQAEIHAIGCILNRHVDVVGEVLTDFGRVDNAVDTMRR